ncbi:MAG: ABC transporter permease [Chloroflexi bacterium]|jgi:ABC-type dipeptide/oligopeptide/nickel transport system permease component|nr:ABC transporter permease [Anaerolineaceae bacterium]NMB91166.1 ABC transporter permease [Chloroflexota bacterium]
MGRYITRRLIYLVVVLLVVSAITFGLMHAVPGGPFDREKALPPEIMANLEKRYHLDDPLIVQYGRYLTDVFIPHLTTEPPSTSLDDDYLLNVKLGGMWLKWANFGPSYASRSRTVNDIFRQQLPVSAQLGTMALLVALVIGMPLGILSALKQNTVFDYIGMSIAIFGVSVPVIVLGPLMIWIFGVTLKWFPPTGWGAKPPYLLGFLPSHLDWEFFKYAFMPSIALGLGSSAIIARLTRASLLQVVREDYIRTARAKGLQERMVILRHALKNSLIPVITIIGPLFAALVTGTFVTELTFGIPGMGKYFVTSITNRDYPVIMGTILLYAVFLVVANLIVDIVYAYLDPRIRYD